MTRSPRRAASSSRFFPPVESCGSQGLVSVGGSLDVDVLLDAYAHGIFPWPSGNILAWWSPDPRAILELDELHISRRLARTLRGGQFDVTRNRDFCQVIRGCATAGDRRRGTWITPALAAAYVRLHRLGHAHSVEVWNAGQLAGGLYGVGMGGLFAAESMFHIKRDASKIALVHLVWHLKARGYALLDIQQLTPHTARFGAKEIPRSHYLARLSAALARQVTFESQRERGV